MGNTTSFNNVTHIVETGGGLLLDASSFANMSTHGPLNLTFNTVWIVDAGDAPFGPYEATSSLAFENLSGKWSGPEMEDDESWWVTWSPEGGEDVNYMHVGWSEMSNEDLAVFQHGFSAALKDRLDTPGAIPLTDDPILGEALGDIEMAMGLT